MTVDILTHTLDTWRTLGGEHTAREIAQQPAVWRALAAALPQHAEKTAAFLTDWLDAPQCQVILTGAGSSAYIGDILSDTLDATYGAQVRAVATTTLLSHPALYLAQDKPTILVSFARSGNSPESIGAVELVAQGSQTHRFLNITCNAEGALALNGEQAVSRTLLMPPAACDKSFAMTSSFSCMLLAALGVLSGHVASAQARIERMADLAADALLRWPEQVEVLAGTSFDRVVFLGSGPLLGLAREAALKVLELTAGRVIALAESPLGFRHGPKAVLNTRTLVVAFRSNDAYARRYEDDLLNELRRDGVAARVVEVGSGQHTGVAGDYFTVAADGLNGPWLAPLWLLMPQLLALQLSVALGIRPDNPFADGTVNRVVQGVTLYPYTGQ